MGWTGEKLGRLKLNGQLLGYSPLSRLIELEGLMLGIAGKLAMWIALSSRSGRPAPRRRWTWTCREERRPGRSAGITWRRPAAGTRSTALKMRMARASLKLAAQEGPDVTE